MELPNIFEDLCSGPHGVNPETLEKVLTLAVELAREGREGLRVGTIFTVGSADDVIKLSRLLILDPLQGHPDDVKHVSDPGMREVVKELAQLDGGFVVTDAGVVRSACRYFDTLRETIDLPLGLGSRHLAGASISLLTHAVAVVVSESAMVRVFDDGSLLAEIIPELWTLRRHGVYLKEGGVRSDENITVVSKNHHTKTP